MTPDRELAAAQAALARGNPQRALEHINESKAFDDSNTWRLQAEAYIALDRYDEAYQSVGQGLRIEPSDSELEICLAQILSHRKDHAAAEAALLRVLNREPENVNALFYYGWVLAQVGDTEGARDIIDRLPHVALAWDPNTQALRAYVAMIEGNNAEATEYINAGLAMDPQSSQLRRLAGLQAQVNSDVGGAADHYIGAAMADPSQSGELGRVGQYLNHPLMAPTRLITRIGPAKLWVGWIVFITLGRRVLPDAVLIPLIVAYVLVAIYSWVAPPLLRAWLKRQGRL